jgi:hypothetical protein
MAWMPLSGSSTPPNSQTSASPSIWKSASPSRPRATGWNWDSRVPLRWVSCTYPEYIRGRVPSTVLQRKRMRPWERGKRVGSEGGREGWADERRDANQGKARGAFMLIRVLRDATISGLARGATSPI